MSIENIYNSIGGHDLIYGNIKILNNTWIAADSFIFMNVSIGPNSIVGARSVVFKTIPQNSIAGGNPAKILKENLTAAGRGEFSPIATNSTSEGRSKNRRTECTIINK